MDPYAIRFCEVLDARMRLHQVSTSKLCDYLDLSPGLIERTRCKQFEPPPALRPKLLAAVERLRFRPR